MASLVQSYPFSSRAQRTGDSPIAWLMKKTIEDPEILSLAAGFVDQDTLPHDLIREAFDRVFKTGKHGQAALQYGTTPGLRELRQVHARRLEDQGLANVDPENLVISNGGQQTLCTITDVLVDPGDVVLVEDPTYFVYMDVLKAAGARTIGVSTDAEGMIPEALEARFDDLHRLGIRNKLKILYVMSYFSNPLGSNMSAERRRRLYEVYRKECDKAGPFVLIEDACYRDLYLEGPDEPFIKALDKDNEWVCLIGTFSKALAPGLRLGWSYLPPELHTGLCRQKANQDFGSSNLNQNILRELLISGAYEDASARFRERYRLKRDCMLAALREFWPEDTDILYPFGGLYVWVRLPGIDTDPGSDFFNAVLEEKVLYVPGYYCYCDETQEPKPKDTMRTCYGVIDMEPMREAVRRMGKVLERFR